MAVQRWLVHLRALNREELTTLTGLLDFEMVLLRIGGWTMAYPLLV
jgi:hypothetical protein